MSNKIKVYIDGKRKFSWKGLIWKYDKKRQAVTFRKIIRADQHVTIEWEN